MNIDKIIEEYRRVSSGIDKDCEFIRKALHQSLSDQKNKIREWAEKEKELTCHDELVINLKLFNDFLDKI
jgi:hypothetical protein